MIANSTNARVKWKSAKAMLTGNGTPNAIQNSLSKDELSDAGCESARTESSTKNEQPNQRRVSGPSWIHAIEDQCRKTKQIHQARVGGPDVGDGRGSCEWRCSRIVVRKNTKTKRVT